jgi:hypothetical protein
MHPLGGDKFAYEFDPGAFDESQLSHMPRKMQSAYEADMHKAYAAAATDLLCKGPGPNSDTSACLQT